MSSTADPAVGDASVTFTATVSAASGGGTPNYGEVSFYVGGNYVGEGSVSGGVATCSYTFVTSGTYSVTASYDGTAMDVTPGYTGSTSSALSQQVQLPPPADVPVPSCNCGCPNVEGALISTAVGAVTNAARDTTMAPVRYGDGVVTIASTDLQSTGFSSAGLPWGQTRSWTNNPAYSSNSSNGNGWVDTQLPSLYQADGTSSIAVLVNGTTAYYYDLVGSSYVSRYNDQSTFTHDATAGEYVLTDGTGAQIRFYDFSTSLPAGQRGQFASYTDTFGNVTSVTSHDSAGRVTEVQSSSTIAGTTVTDSHLYAYVTTGVNAGLLACMRFRTPVAKGGWTVVRQVE